MRPDAGEVTHLDPGDNPDDHQDRVLGKPQIQGPGCLRHLEVYTAGSVAGW